MPKYVARLTVFLEFDADNEDNAELIMQEMDYFFNHPLVKKEISSEIVDVEIEEDENA